MYHHYCHHRALEPPKAPFQERRNRYARRRYAKSRVWLRLDPKRFSSVRGRSDLNLMSPSIRTAAHSTIPFSASPRNGTCRLSAKENPLFSV